MTALVILGAILALTTAAYIWAVLTDDDGGPGGYIDMDGDQ